MMRSTEIDGQISMFEYIEHIKPRPVDIMGICDDAYCPECGYGFMDPKENDLPECPICKCKVDWTPWHRANDGDNYGS